MTTQSARTVDQLAFLDLRYLRDAREGERSHAFAFAHPSGLLFASLHLPLFFRSVRISNLCFSLLSTRKLVFMLCPCTNPLVWPCQWMIQVRNDYQNLRQEILEVQELQRQVSDRLRQQVQQVQGRFISLKERIAAVPNN